MARSAPNQPGIIALLSAVTTATADKSGALAPGMTLVGGEPLLEHQISALRGQGISRFLLEVDSVAGSLLELADRLRARGCQIEFVRSTGDLQKAVDHNNALFVQTEALYLSDDLLGSMLAQKTPFIATVDGRDENAAFERMDLNTRWAGVALISAGTIASLENLPEGWSITSSLLRQAMRAETRLLALPQRHIQDGKLKQISSAAEADLLSRQILVDRSARQGGIVERRIFAPIAARLATLIWRHPSGSNGVDLVTMILAVATVPLAATGWITAAIIAAIVAMFGMSIRAAVRDLDQDTGFAKWMQPVCWVLLAGAAVAAARTDYGYSGHEIYAVTVMLGLALLSQQLNLPVWAQHVLKSPAVLALTLLCCVLILGFAESVQWISLAQIGALLVAKWSPNLAGKKAKQA
jgi:hypothetical protein